MTGNGYVETVRDAISRVDLWPETVAIVLNVPAPLSMSFLAEVRRTLNRKGRPDVLIIQKMPGTSIDVLSVDDMRQVGWIRMTESSPAHSNFDTSKKKSIFEKLKVWLKGDGMPEG